MKRSIISCFVGLALVLGVAVTGSAAPIQPGEDVQDELQEALILVGEGGVIELGEGVFEFVGSLSLAVDGVTLRGQGMDKTILSFKNQDAGSEGLIITSSGVTLRDFAVEDTIGDAIKVRARRAFRFITCAPNGPVVRRQRTVRMVFIPFSRLMSSLTAAWRSGRRMREFTWANRGTSLCATRR